MNEPRHDFAHMKEPTRSVRTARERQVVLLEGLALLAMQQRSVLATEDLSPLPELLTQRQVLIDELVSLDAWCEAQPASSHTGCDALRARVREMATQVRTQDEADLRLMQQRMEAAKQELAELRGSTRALGAYAQAGPSDAMAQDIMG